MSDTVQPTETVRSKRSIARAAKKARKAAQVDKSSPAVRPKTLKTNGYGAQTTVGHSTYKIKTLPELCVADVDVLYKTESTEESVEQISAWVPVRGRYLRDEALGELIDKIGLKSIKDMIAINTKSGLRNQLIIAPQWLDGVFKAKLEPQKVDLALKQGGPESGNPIRCEITAVMMFSGDDTKNETYVKNLKFFVENMHRDTLLTEPSIAADQIDPLAWNFSHDARAFDRSNLPNTSHVYPLRLRNQVSINVTEKSLRMDFNLVPCIPDPQKNPKDKKHLRAILGDVFGQALHDGNVSQYLPMLQDFFLGMEVKRNYRPDEPFKLVDVAMPQNFKPSVIKGVAGNSTSYTVVDYFNQVILEDGKKIEYPHFPLVRGGLDSWFPMEMLQPVKEQPLHRFEPLLPTLKKHVVQFSKLDRAGEAVAKKQADDFFDEFTKGVATRRPFFEVDGEGKFTPIDLVESAWL